MGGNGEAKKRASVEPLPAQDDKFWEKAEKHRYELREITCGKGEHEFVYVGTGGKVECRKCSIGYILPIGAEIKDKHIYFKGQLVI